MIRFLPIVAGVIRHIIGGGGAVTAIQAWNGGDKVTAAVGLVSFCGATGLSVIEKVLAHGHRLLLKGEEVLGRVENLKHFEMGVGRQVFEHEAREDARPPVGATGPTMPITGAALIALVCGLIFSGCATADQAVPANRISIVAPSGTYEIATPKNVAVTKFAATVQSNGVFTLTFDKWSSTNDPQVIDKSYAGQVAVEKARFEGINGILDKALEAGKRGAAATATGGGSELLGSSMTPERQRQVEEFLSQVQRGQR